MRLFNFFAIMFLLVGALAFSACTDTDTETLPAETVTLPAETVTLPGSTEYVCLDGTTEESADMCPEAEPVYDDIGMLGEGECYEDGDRDGMVQGTDMGDCIHGEDGNDSIKGLGGNDTLDGGSGDDTLYGGAGDDGLIGGSGDNTLYGGEDTDTAVYKDAMRVVVNLGNNMARVRHADPEMVDELVEVGDSGIGTDTLMEIENAEGSLLGEDILNGDDNANVLKGLDQADTINGHGGDDIILPNRPALEDGMPNVASGTAPEIDGIDVVDGGEGNDTISYEGESNVVTIDLSATATPGFIEATDTDFAYFTAIVTSGERDRIKVVNRGTAEDPKLESTIENLTGGSNADELTGDVRANILIGGAGNDTLNGEADGAEMGGDDTLNGGAGDDQLNGGPGNDTLNGGGDTDTLNGDAGDDTLDGGGGTDTLDGGEGDDQYIITKGDVDTIAEFVAGDRISLKGFMGDEKLNVDTANGELEVQDPDDSDDVTVIANITEGSDVIRLTQDVEFID